jgi:hypothetical protein
VIHGIRFGGSFEAEVGESVSLVQKYAIAMRHQHRCAGNLLLGDDAPGHRIEIGGAGLGVAYLGVAEAAKTKKSGGKGKRGRPGSHAVDYIEPYTTL